MTRRSIHAWATFGAVLVALSAPAMAEKHGGILRSYSIDSPASLSIHEEVTIYALRPVMGVFNNLVHVRPAREAEQHGLDRPRSRRELELGRGRCTIDVQIA